MKQLSISGVAVSGVAVIVYLLVGCDRTSQITDYSSLGLVPVCGHVFLDDIPLAAVDVIFESEDQTWSYATTDSLGWYQLQFNSEQNGVLPGPKTVRIRAHAASDESFDDQSEKLVVHDAVTDFPDHPTRNSQAATDLPGAQRPVIPTCYDRKSSLRVVITTATRTVNLNLRSDCSAGGLQIDLGLNSETTRILRAERKMSKGVVLDEATAGQAVEKTVTQSDRVCVGFVAGLWCSRRSRTGGQTASGDSGS